MQIIHGAIALMLLAVALLHVPHPTPFIWVPYALASALAVITVFADVGQFFARLLAISTTMLMFFFFSGFFMDVPKLESDWYVRPEGWFEPFSWETNNKGTHVIHSGGKYDSYLQVPVIPPKYQAGDYIYR